MNIAIERYEDGTYSVWNTTGDDCTLIGTGENENEAIEDFKNSIKEMKEWHEEDGSEYPPFLNEPLIVEIHALISRTDSGYNAGWGHPDSGVIQVTGSTIDEVKSNFIESLKLHIDGNIADCDPVPDYLESGNYIVKFDTTNNCLL